MSHASRSHNFLWMSAALLPLVAVSFLLPIQPQDYWWVLRVGQDTLQSGAIPTTDAISLSQFGQPIVYQTWLAGVVFYLTHQLGGITSAVLLRGALLGVAYGIVWGVAREASNARLATVLVVVLGLASGNNWAMRSQLFAYPLFALTLWSLLKWRDGAPKHLWVLPVVTALWANLHGSFVLPLVLAGMAALFGKGDRKFLALVLPVMALATLVNPRGIGVWNYFFFMLNSPSDQLFAFEWAPPRNAGWQMNLFFGWLILFAPLAALSPKKLSAFEWALFLAFAWLALTGLRYVIWFLFILTILTAALLSEQAKRFDAPRRSFPALDIAFGILLLSAALIFLPGIREQWLGAETPVYEASTSPVAATEWLRRHPGLDGELFADYAFGGYLSFNLQMRRPWMDSRFNAFPPEQWEEYVKVSAGENWREVFDREEINLLMLSVASQPKLIRAVEESRAWSLEYRDPYAVVFARRR